MKKINQAIEKNMLKKIQANSLNYNLTKKAKLKNTQKYIQVKFLMYSLLWFNNNSNKKI